MKRAILLVLLAWSGPARAQAPTPAAALPEEPQQTDVTLKAVEVDASNCARLDITPGALLQPRKTGPNVLATPIPWSEFEIQGQLVDPPATVRALLDPTLQQLRTSLSTATLPQLAEVTARFGYQLVGQRTQDLPNGAKLILNLSPLPIVKRVDVDVDESWRGKLLEDEVRRRMGVRPGSYLPWDSLHRGCAMFEERRRIEEFLFDEGFFDIGAKKSDARVEVSVALDESGARVLVKVRLGDRYQLGKVTIACPSGFERQKGICIDPVTNVRSSLVISDADIERMFHHAPPCLLYFICISKPGFSRTLYQEDLQALKDRFHKLGYPAVRVVSSDPRASTNFAKKRVLPVLTIDQRRRVEPIFVGYDSDVVSEAELRGQLTFDDAGSADDVEAAASARKLTTFLQQRGFFDAKVTWTRDRVDFEPKPGTTETGLHEDKITFRIDTGSIRRVTTVEFVGNRTIPTKVLAQLVATKPSGFGNALFGGSSAATSAELINDQERIKEAYRREGYPETTVWPSASTAPIGLGDSAATAAMLALDERNELHVRFTIEEGPPTLLSRIIVQGEGEHPVDDQLCTDVLGELARSLATPQIATRTDKDKCAATVGNLKYRADDIASTRDYLRDRLFKTGRARAGVDYAATPIGPHRMEVRYTIKSPTKLRIGKIVIRGNFKTRESVIRDELRLQEGQLVTSDALAEGARRLRNTGLFDAVNIDMPDLDCGRERQCNSEVINAVVRVEERYINTAEITAEAGYSSQNGAFGRGTWGQRNIGGLGMVFTVSGTLGTKLQEAEGTFRFPQWLSPFPDPVDFSTEVNGLYRVQDTPRFGVLTTQGAGIALSRAWPHARTETESAYSIGGSLHYDFRLRSRNVDAVRPIGSDMDESQVAISTRTGSVGVTAYFDHRIDRRGQLTPLAPEGGSYLEASFSWADPVFLGQDRFLKFYVAASKFIPIGANGVLRIDGRYDQGYPIGDEVLLPEVERFFAGGDSTVRGYEDDRLATEVIQVGVPPLDNVTQIRVIPAGGNIRALGSIDGQLRIWKLFAGALFMDAGLITNKWSSVAEQWRMNPADLPGVRPSVGMGLRALTPFGIGAIEYAVPLKPQLGDDPRGRIHVYFAARAQF